MKLESLIEGIVPLESVNGNPEVRNICFDSRKAGEGSCFVAQVGTRVDGHDYIETAISQGAVAVVCQRKPEALHQGVTYVLVENSDLALGIMADNYYGHPSRRLKLVGVTGTNGKTTTVTLLHSMFRKHGCHVGLLSTIVNKIDDEEIPSTHTTPDALELNSLLSRMVEAGCTYAFMEVSSHICGRSVQQHHA